MEPKDKFGNVIYPSKFSILLKNGEILSSSGYSESHIKPNLFHKELPQGWLYADMRGTKEIPIWKDTRPLFYWRFTSLTPMWERRRIIKNELVALFKANCPCRLSFHVHENEEFRDTSASIDGEHGEYDWDDGYCRVCGKDFRGEGGFCSLECEARNSYRPKPTCEACGKEIEFSEIAHHVSYYPERIVYVHKSCHQEIHKTDKYPQLKPSQEDMDKSRIRQSRKILKQKKIDAFRLDEKGNYNCYRCRCSFGSLYDMKIHLETHKRKMKGGSGSS